jgi:hypothetical protein
MKLASSNQITLRHRVVYRDGWWEAGDFAKLASAFRNSPG